MLGPRGFPIVEVRPQDEELAANPHRWDALFLDNPAKVSDGEARQRGGGRYVEEHLGCGPALCRRFFQHLDVSCPSWSNPVATMDGADFLFLPKQADPCQYLPERLITACPRRLIPDAPRLFVVVEGHAGHMSDVERP